MRALIACPSSADEARGIADAFRIINPGHWRLHLVLPSGPSTDIEGATVHRFDDQLSAALTLARECEISWIMRSGARPEIGAIEAIEHWCAERGAEAMYGDSLGPGGVPQFRPRFGPVRLTSSGDIGSSLILRRVPDLRFTARSDDARWYELLLAVIDWRIEHIPVILEAISSVPTIDTGGRAAVLYPGDPLAVQRSDSPYLLPVPATPTARASVIIPSIGSPAQFGEDTYPALYACLRSLTSPHIHEIIIVAGPAMPREVLRRAQEIAPAPLIIVQIDGPFNFSASCNLGASHATGEIFLFLNDDVETTSPNWVEPIIALAEREEVGAVGARLVFPDHTIQHAGVLMNPGDGLPAHLDYRCPLEDASLIGRTTGEYLVVTGACLAVSAADYEAVGGMCERLPINFNDVDLCLKLINLGRSNVCCNMVTLIHRESTSRESTVFDWELEFMDQWHDLSLSDPFPYLWS